MTKFSSPSVSSAPQLPTEGEARAVDPRGAGNNSGFPLLPDSEGAAVRPHPDGQPKRKACDECAFRMSDPQEMGRQYQDHLLKGDPDTLFYCVHRLEQGRHRVCACYAAFHPEQRA